MVKKLDAKVTEAEGYLSQTDKYTEESLVELQAAIDAAKEIIDGINNGEVYEQSAVDKAEEDIAKAIAGLKLKDDNSEIGYCVTFDYNYAGSVADVIEVEPGTLLTGKMPANPTRAG